MYIGSSLKRRG